MYKRRLIAALLSAWATWPAVIATPAMAQNTTCATRPIGDESNACASTQFVANATATIAPTSTTDFNTKIANAIEAGLTGLFVTPTTYSVAKTTTGSDGSAVAVLINHPGNFTLDGQGSVLSLVGADVPSYANIIQVQNAVPGTTITLKNFTLKYTSPPFAQATLTSNTACVGGSGGVATFAMQSGFAPAWASIGRIDQYNPITDLFVTNIWSPPSTVLPFTNLGGGNYSVAFSGTSACTALATMTDNDTYNLENAQFGYEAVRFQQDANIVLDNVRVVDSAGHAWLVVGANDITAINGTGVYPALGAYHSTNGGAEAIIYASGRVINDPSVVMKATGDDSFFSAPYAVAITTVNSLTSLVVPGTFPGTYIQAGDTLQFLDPTGVLQGRAIVSSITSGSGNSTLTLSSAAPSSVANTWIIYDQSQAPSLVQINGGVYGPSPTRAIFADATNVEITGPHTSDTGSAGVLVQFGYGGGNGGVGLVPYSVTINGVVTNNNNYNDAAAGSIDVEGWNQAQNAPAPAGQIPFVTIENINCVNAGSSCEYVSGALTTNIQSPTSNTWYTLGTAPPLYQPGCALYTAAVAFCNDTNASVGPGTFITSGMQIAISGVTNVLPSTVAGSFQALSSDSLQLGVETTGAASQAQLYFQNTASGQIGGVFQSGFSGDPAELDVYSGGTFAGNIFKFTPSTFDLSTEVVPSSAQSGNYVCYNTTTGQVTYHNAGC